MEEKDLKELLDEAVAAEEAKAEEVAEELAEEAPKAEESAIEAAEEAAPEIISVEAESVVEEETAGEQAEEAEAAAQVEETEASFAEEFEPAAGAADTAQKQAAPSKPKKKSKKLIALALAACMVFSLCVGVAGSDAIKGAWNNAKNSALNIVSEEASPDNAVTKEDVVLGVGTTLEQATGSELTIAEIAALTANAVVEIQTESVAYDSWFGQYVTSGAGSGVIISPYGYIVTNNHVIENARSIKVTLKDGSEHDATLIGTDAQSDVAVIKIEASNLTSAVYGDSDTLRVGDLSVVIGNPLGRLGGSVTAGIISALDREITLDGKQMNLLQTDASINPGNSGGGLFNSKGELVGLVVAKSGGTNVEGLGFAIPVNEVKTVADQLVKSGYVTGRPALGIKVADLTSTQNAIRYGVRQLGIYVSEVSTPNASAAGFQEGDMLYYVGDTRISSYNDIAGALQGKSVGDTVKVTVVRDNRFVELNVVLSERTNG